MLSEDDKALLATLEDVLSRAHAGHMYTTDWVAHGVADYWAADLVGDCEDFALWCRDELAKEGIESDLVLCQTIASGLHLVLSVQGWILDNRSGWVRRRDDVEYTWLKIGKPDGKWYEIEGQRIVPESPLA